MVFKKLNVIYKCNYTVNYVEWLYLICACYFYIKISDILVLLLLNETDQ